MTKIKQVMKKRQMGGRMKLNWKIWKIKRKLKNHFGQIEPQTTHKITRPDNEQV